MSAPIRFYFDFTSTYSYIAVHQIDDLAARYGRGVEWNAVSLGHIFNAIGQTPPPFIPDRLKYNLVDFPRSCAFAGLPCRMPDVFPFDAKHARYVFWTLNAKDTALARAFTRAVMTRSFGLGGKIETAAEIAEACINLPGLDEAAIAEAAANPAAKRAVVAAMDSARADGMIGAPFMVLDGEPFWGADRFDQIKRRLAEKR
jgi:2-hydroxychromene-2-carboxylate isomerase